MLIPNYKGKKVIVRTYSAGVWFGEIGQLKGMECILLNARRLWYWDGAASLSQLAESGTTKPSNCKFTVTITDKEGVYLPQVIEVLPCSEEAVKSINSVEIWRV